MSPPAHATSLVYEASGNLSRRHGPAYHRRSFSRIGIFDWEVVLGRVARSGREPVLFGLVVALSLGSLLGLSYIRRIEVIERARRNSGSGGSRQ